jgi:hypothetical protein
MATALVSGEAGTAIEVSTLAGAVFVSAVTHSPGAVILVGVQARW